MDCFGLYGGPRERDERRYVHPPGPIFAEALGNVFWNSSHSQAGPVTHCPPVKVLFHCNQRQENLLEKGDLPNKNLPNNNEDGRKWKMKANQCFRTLFSHKKRKASWDELLNCLGQARLESRLQDG
eukprot:g61022.t1